MTRLTDYDGSHLDYAFDGYGRVSTMTDYAGTAANTWYDVVAAYSGSNITVWRSTGGGAWTEVLSTTEAEVLTNTKVRFCVFPNTAYQIDNVSLQAETEVTSTFGYNNANELTKLTEKGVDTNLTYDASGRLVTKAKGTYQAVYQYNYGQFLRRVDTNFPGETSTSFQTDALGKRRVKTVMADVNNSATWTTTTYRWDLGYNVISEYGAGSDGTTDWDIGTRSKTLVHAGMMTLAEVDGTDPSSGTTRYYAHDHLGSARALYSSAKAELGTTEHNPYGDSYATTGMQAAYTFTGKPFDASIGMYYFPYRYYSPQMSRWTTRDPLGMLEGPNVYAYVGAKVIEYSDPEGLGKCKAAAKKVWNLLKRLKTLWDAKEDAEDKAEVIDDATKVAEDLKKACDKIDQCKECPTGGGNTRDGSDIDVFITDVSRAHTSGRQGLGAACRAAGTILQNVGDATNPF